MEYRQSQTDSQGGKKLMSNQFWNVMNEINALFNNNEENFDSCHEYCFDTWGKVLGHFYFNAWYNMKNRLPPEAKQTHDHILKINGNVTTCLDCDLWERKESKQIIQTLNYSDGSKINILKCSKCTNNTVEDPTRNDLCVVCHIKKEAVQE